MISHHRLPDLTPIQDLKTRYLENLVAPMDGMWEVGFTDPAPHWELTWDEERAGYFAANDDGDLLQFYLLPEFEPFGRTLFDYVIGLDLVKKAVVSTIDPLLLSHCLDVQQSVSVHTYLYERRSETQPNDPAGLGMVFRLIQASELERTVDLQRACLGGENDLTEWLRGYSSRLIARSELFVLISGNEWLGLGECRRSESQPGISDLGMMVAPEHRGKGLATYILTLLAHRSDVEGRRSICSTTVDNVASQKAIERAGFVTRHRIMNVEL